MRPSLWSEPDAAHLQFIFLWLPADVSGDQRKSLLCDREGPDCPASLLATAISDLCETSWVGDPHAGVHACTAELVSCVSLSTAQ